MHNSGSPLAGYSGLESGFITRLLKMMRDDVSNYIFFIIIIMKKKKLMKVFVYFLLPL